MATWTLQDDDGDVVECDEVSLRKKLRDGELSGIELVRREGEQKWISLHSLPMFAEEVPHEGNPERIAAWRAVRGWFGHAMGFGGFVSLFAWIPGAEAWIWWVIGPWAIAFAGHTWRVIPAARIAVRSLRGALDPAPVAHSQAISGTDAFLDGLDKALERVEAALAGSPSITEKPDVGALRSAAEAMHRQRLALAPLLAGRPELEANREALATRIVASTGVARSALESEKLALEERLAALEQAAATSEQLESRERALLHHLDSITLAVLRVGGTGATDPALSDALQKLDAALRTEAEIEDALDPRRRPGMKQAP